MDKEEFLKMLDDPDVMEKVKSLVRPNSVRLTPAEDRNVKAVISWWKTEGGKVEESILSVFDKKEISGSIKKNGVTAFKNTLKKAIGSPLNKEGEMMHKYLSDLVWCCKPKNYSKILLGNYDNAYKKKDEEYQNESESIEDLKGLMD